MQLPVSSISALALAAHLIVGCCWHHSHSECAALGPLYEWTGEGRPCASEPCVPAHRHGAPGGKCDGERCIFLRSEKSPQPRGAFAVWLRGLAATRAASPAHAGQASSASPSRWLVQLPPPAIRSHLLLRVLLI